MIIEPLMKYLTTENVSLYGDIRGVIPDGIIAGGAARQIFLDEAFGSTDIDFYFHSWGVWDAIYNYLYGRHVRYHKNRNAVGYNVYGTKVQLISKYFSDDPQAIFNTFDFTCCMFAIKGDYIYYTEEAAEHARKKLLVFANTNNSSDELYRRIGKYLKKGYLPACAASNSILEEFIKYIYESKEAADDNLFGPTWNTIEELKGKMDEFFSSFFGNIAAEDY